jgi:hypothetical protein
MHHFNAQRVVTFRDLGEFQYDMGMNNALVGSEYRVKTSTNQAVKSEAVFWIEYADLGMIYGRGARRNVPGVRHEVEVLRVHKLMVDPLTAQ